MKLKQNKRYHSNFVPQSPVSINKPTRKPQTQIDSYEFTKTWMTSNSLNDVCERPEITDTQASAKANNLRKRGVKLPKMSRRPDKNSVEELNKLVERYAK
jgi:hypothetical protein